MQLKKVNTIFAVVLVSLLMLSACSTKKNTWTRRAYHNLTAHYNAWWNGNQSLREGIKNLEETAKDNYLEVLPVYNVGTSQEAMSISANADRATEKASIVIQQHSMYFNKKENCKWIDDSYYMIGKAYFYKQEYRSARRTFEFIISKYNDPDMIIASRLMLARTFDALKLYGQSGAELENIRIMADNEELTLKQHEKYRETYANHFILKGEPDFAVPFLKEIVVFGKRDMRKRGEFILGQIYMKQGDLKSASSWFVKAAKGAPTYELEFNSRINHAMCYDGGGDGSSIMHQLEKMLADEKNEDYSDQIYYAMSRISLREADVPKTIEYLQLSVATSISNNYQKAMSALELSDIFFEIPNYTMAQAYYDTTMQVLPKDYPGYKELERKTIVLSKLVENLMVISEQDSLQKIAAMSEADRNAVIDKIIEAVIAEEIAQREREIRMMEEAQRGGTGLQGTNTTGKWYFYNQQTVTQGRKEFLGKWGKRTLEDLWILSNKQQSSFETWEESEEAGAEGEGAAVDSLGFSTNPKNRETYLQNLPFSEEQLLASDKLISNALFNAGLIYRGDLNDTTEFLTLFNSLAERFPDTAQNSNLVITYYALYQTYTDIGNQPKADEFKQLIIGRFPESDYAKVLINPDYFKKLEERANAASTLYTETYQALKDKQFYVVLLNAETAHTDFESDSLLPYFDLLNALAIGGLESRDKMDEQLLLLVENYPLSPVIPLAKELLGFKEDVGGRGRPTGADPQDPSQEPSTATLTDEDRIAAALEKWDLKPDNQQYCVIVVKAASRDVRALQIRISDFNKKNNRFDKLKINSVVYDAERQMLSIGIFKDVESVTKYYRSVLNDDYIMGMLNKKPFNMFCVETEDYKELYRTKDITDYELFFKETYLK